MPGFEESAPQFGGSLAGRLEPIHPNFLYFFGQLLIFSQ